KSCLGVTYGCSSCNFFLHKSCAELPTEIQNFAHPSHPLSLLILTCQNPKKFKCNICLKDCRGFIFHCRECNFQLDVECASLTPTVNFGDHPHRLTVVDNIYDELECCACNGSCIGSPAFRCLKCNFNLHLVCGPLPITIKHKCHIDPLTLKDFYVEDDDDDEFYCDACELPRNPRLCVYYCETGCPMIVDVKCVISEVIPALRGERGDVKLRTVGRQITSNVIIKDLMVKEMKQNETDKETREGRVEIESALSFDDIFHSLNASEKNEISIIISKMQTERKRGKESIEAKKQDSPAFTEENLAEFMERLKAYTIPLWKPYNRVSSSLRSRKPARVVVRRLFGVLFKPTASVVVLNGPSVVLDHQLPIFFLQHNKFITVGDMLVPRTLIPIYEELLSKYKNIGATSRLSPKVKSLIFYILCRVIQNMRTTKVVDVTEDKLGEWLGWLKWVECAGFEIQFIFEHMERIARAYFVLRTRKLLEDSEVEQEQDIEWISEKMEKLKTKLERTRAKSEATKEQLSYHKTHEKEFLKGTAVSIKWKPVTDGLL
ncbi:uncharacterized protein LOC110656553, partial [Hevea brasiliensis]|uniref:uncharacterized protein LOC110656553 n=1 Tax=Hevea brasiliensis TaxID=3981 RepID=UPI0025F58005